MQRTARLKKNYISSFSTTKRTTISSQYNTIVLQKRFSSGMAFEAATNLIIGSPEWGLGLLCQILVSNIMIGQLGFFIQSLTTRPGPLTFQDVASIPETLIHITNLLYELRDNIDLWFHSAEGFALTHSQAETIRFLLQKIEQARVMIDSLESDSPIWDMFPDDPVGIDLRSLWFYLDEAQDLANQLLALG